MLWSSTRTASEILDMLNLDSAGVIRSFHYSRNQHSTIFSKNNNIDNLIHFLHRALYAYFSGHDQTRD